ncbi:MAG: hypothetical protein EOP11_06790 [Proteobacteria bacterium]|nr:MAG: hypothetical protein EOP11_06790 [Pseudomonadota bacterium]
MNQILKWLLIITGSMVAFGALPFLVAPLVNNHNLNKLEERFLNVKHPSRSDSVKRFSKVGLLHHGNGNNCSYVVGEVRSTSGELSEALASYADLRIASTSGKAACEVRALALAPLLAEPDSMAGRLGFYDDSIFRDLEAASGDKEKLYLLTCADTMHPAGFDIRCH